MRRTENSNALCCDAVTSASFGLGSQNKHILPIRHKTLQRRARRHAAINVVDFSNVRRCQNRVDVSDVTTCQNIRKVSEHIYPDKNVM